MKMWNWSRFRKSRMGMPIMFLLMAALPLVVHRPYIQAILVMTVYIASCSLAWSILGGMLGKISIGHASFAAVGAYIGTVLYNEFNISPWISMLAAFLVVGLLVALLMMPCFGLKGAYFSLTTIAFGEAFRNLFTNWNTVGAGQGLKMDIVRKGEESLWMLAFRDKSSYFYVGLALLVVFYLAVLWIDRSKFGYGLKTIRENEETAEAIGINPLRYKTLATFISTGMVAVMGVFYACYIRYISPDLMLQSKSLEFVLPAVIGGISTVEGPVIGTLLIVPLSQYLNSALGSRLPGSNLIVYALILIVVVLFCPSGLLGYLRTRQQKKRIAAEKVLLEREA